MNTDFNQFLVFRKRFNLYIGMLIKGCKKNDSLYQLNNYDVNAFVELFDMCMYAHCSV